MKEKTRNTLEQYLTLFPSPMSQASLASNLNFLASSDDSIRIDAERVIEDIHHRDRTDKEIKDAIQGILDRPESKAVEKRPNQEAWDLLWASEEEARIADDNPWEM